MRSQCEETAPTAVWPLLADVGDQCGLWRGRNQVNEERSVQRNTYSGARHYVGDALIVILWLRAGYVETILAGFESRNREVTSLIGRSCRDLTPTLPFLQIPSRWLYTSKVLKLVFLEEGSIGASLDGYPSAGHSQRVPFFIVVMTHQVYPSAANYCPGHLPHCRRCIASDDDYIARIK